MIADFYQKEVKKHPPWTYILLRKNCMPVGSQSFNFAKIWCLS